MTLPDYATKLTRAQERRRIAIESLATTSARKTKLQTDSANLEKAQAFIQGVAKDTQEHLRFHIEDLVQLGLDACFPEKYQFQLTFEIKRGQTEARLCFVNAAGHEINPMDANGGGVVDLAAFALRIAAWTLGKTDNLIVLDEPFRFLSKGLRPRAAEIMKELSVRLNLQFILITHDPDIVDVADRVFTVTQEKGLSDVHTQ